MGTGILLAASSYTRAITNLKSVLLTLGSAIGAVMLVYGGIKFAMAFRQMDQQGEHQAVTNRMKLEKPWEHMTVYDPRIEECKFFRIFVRVYPCTDKQVYEKRQRHSHST